MMKVMVEANEASKKKRMLNIIEEFDHEQSEQVDTTQSSSMMFKK